MTLEGKEGLRASKSELAAIRYYVGALEAEVNQVNFNVDALLRAKLLEPLQSTKNARAHPAHLEIPRARDTNSVIPFAALVFRFNLPVR